MISICFYENKLITMSTIQKDETCVTGIAVMDGELLQNKVIWSMDPEDVAKFYNDDHDEYELDDLDNKIWDSMGWNVIVSDGHNVEKLIQAFKNIPKNDSPSVIIANTTKGKGISFMENKVEWHYKTPNMEEYDIALKELKI